MFDWILSTPLPPKKLSVILGIVWLQYDNIKYWNDFCDVGYMLPINHYYTREGIFSKLDSFNNLLIVKYNRLKYIMSLRNNVRPSISIIGRENAFSYAKLNSKET